jgi:hypothetical protein
MKGQKTPPIRDSKTKKLVVDEEKRQCKRFTFGKDIIKHFSDIVEPFLQDFLDYDPNIQEVKVDPTHGDILYYDKGGFFKKHRDQVPEKCPFYPDKFRKYYNSNRIDYSEPKGYYDRNDWKMYTLIVCLDTTQDTNDGNTLIWSVDNEILFSKDISQYIFFINEYSTICHSFKLNKMDFLLFSSESVHEATPLLQDKMTLKLKLDVWIRNWGWGERFERYKCPCTLCEKPLTYRRQLILRALSPLNKYLTKNILDYTDFLKPVDRCIYKTLNIKKQSLYNNLMCSCIKCIGDVIKYELERDAEYSDDYGYCNDYDDDYDMCNGYEYSSY